MKIKVFVLIISIFIMINILYAKDDRGMMIYGEGFSFILTEPINQTGNTQDAGQYGVNVYFIQNGFNFKNSPCIIYTRVMTKSGSNIKDDLEYDMMEYKQKYPDIKFIDLELEGIQYKYFAKIYKMTNGNSDYCCYIDTGDKNQLYFIFVMTGDSKTCEEEKTTFNELVKSFTWMTDDVSVQ